MSDLVPTIIRLPEDELRRFKKIAAKSEVSFSSLVREALDESFPHEIVARKKKVKLSFYDIGKIAVKGGPKDGSISHDYYLNKQIEETRG